MVETLHTLAEKYETRDFIVGDPSWFMHQVEKEADKELIAFIASALSYGSRKQFLPKIQLLLDDISHYYAETTNYKDMAMTKLWLIDERYKYLLNDSSQSFYRLYSHSTFRKFLDVLREMVIQYGSIKDFLIAKNNITEGKKISGLDAIKNITLWFYDNGSIGVIPKDTASSCKRVCMFLRWMVRKGSPVDIGIWSDIISQESLIIPMDTHVVQEAIKMKLITSRSTSMSNALKLTQELKKVFPDDPTKGDFALFGLGVDEELRRVDENNRINSSTELKLSQD